MLSKSTAGASDRAWLTISATPPISRFQSTPSIRKSWPAWSALSMKSRRSVREPVTGVKERSSVSKGVTPYVALGLPTLQTAFEHDRQLGRDDADDDKGSERNENVGRFEVGGVDGHAEPKARVRAEHFAEHDADQRAAQADAEPG